MKKNLIVASSATLFLLLLLHINVFGTELQTPVGGRGTALGNASTALVDFWSLQNNQAGLASLDQTAASVFYQNRYLVNELGLRGAGLIFPTRTGVVGLQFQKFGYALYSENKIGLAFGKKLGHDFSMGVQLDYLNYRITGDYGNKGLLTFELGAMKTINEHVVIAAHLFNPLQVKMENVYHERLPAVFKLGVGWSVSKEILLLLETEKDVSFKPLFRCGLEYKAGEVAFARIGFSTLPARTGSDKMNVASLYSFGFGLELNHFTIDFGTSVHQVLGCSPAISLVYGFNKR
jgi:hypothetical protein